MIIDHILILDENKPIKFSDLTEQAKDRIIKLDDFKKFIEKKSGQNVQLCIDFYFPKNSVYSNSILFFPENKLDFSQNLIETDLSNYAQWFQIENFYGNLENKDLKFSPGFIGSEILNSNRDDDSAFALSKACLHNQVTYGFNLDKVIFLKKQQKAFVFEFLLCDESQVVSPHTSHPNRYFHKNSSKFINLYNFTRDTLKSDLFLINYAKENTKHKDKVKLMRVDSLNSKDVKSPMITKDLNITPINLRDTLLKKIFPETTITNKPEY